MPKSTVLEESYYDLKTKVKGISMLFDTDVNKDKCALIVEGPDDKKFYSNYVNSSNVIVCVCVAEGCYNLLEILNMVNKNLELKNKIIAIKDADFDHIAGRTYEYDNLFMTDTHDWETMTMTDDVERKISNEYLDEGKTGLFEQVMSDLLYYSYIRYYNDWIHCEKQEKGILFKGLNIESIYNGVNAVDLLSILEIIKSHGNNSKLDNFPNDLTIETFKTEHPVLDLKQLSRGHDVVGALRCWIKVRKKGKNINDNVISIMLRTGFSKQDFMATKLYKDINQWSESHGYHIWTI